MIKNIGTLEDKILIFGGPYSNLQATEAVLQRAQELEIPASNIICTGDITAYCAQPQETAQILYDSKIHIIQGNCDESLAKDSDDCDCGFDRNTACEVFADRWYNFSKSETSSEMKQWMGTLPFRIEFNFSGKNFHVLHGSYDKINEFIFPSVSDDYLHEQISKTNTDVVISGHNGMHFTRIINQTAWHNPGVIGMPANDGTPKTWYSTIEDQGDNIIFKHHRLEYDYNTTAIIMIKNTLNEYAKTITEGVWPSLDILPSIEKSNSGKKLEEKTIYFKK